MKKFISTSLIIALFTIFSIETFAQDKRQKAAKSDIQLEQKVRMDAIDKVGENFNIQSYTVEDDYIRVAGVKDGTEMKVYYTMDGEFEEVVHIATYSSLPESVKEAFMNSNFSHTDIQKVFFVSMEEEDFFAIKAVKSGDIRYVFINPDGDNVPMEKKLLFTNEFYEK